MSLVVTGSATTLAGTTSVHSTDWVHKKREKIYHIRGNDTDNFDSVLARFSLIGEK